VKRAAARKGDLARFGEEAGFPVKHNPGFFIAGVFNSFLREEHDHTYLFAPHLCGTSFA
jgi:hypothetical protein